MVVGGIGIVGIVAGRSGIVIVFGGNNGCSTNGSVAGGGGCVSGGVVSGMDG